MNKYFTPTLLGYLSVLGATVIWAGNFILARGLNTLISPISLSFWRWVVAALICLPFAYTISRNQLPLIRKHIVYLAFCALLGVSLFNTLIYIAGHSTSAMNLSLISLTFPVFILILGVIFHKDKVNLKQLVGVSAVIIGVLILITKGHLAKLFQIHFAIGDLYVLIAALTFAIYSILLKRKPAELNVWTFQLTTFILGLLFLLPFYLWDLTRANHVMIGTIITQHPSVLASIFYVGCFASLCAFVLWNKAIMLIGAAKAGMVYYVQPLFCGALAYLFLNEAIGLYHFYSLLLIVAGIVVANYQKRL